MKKTNLCNYSSLDYLVHVLSFRQLIVHKGTNYHYLLVLSRLIRVFPWKLTIEFVCILTLVLSPRGKSKFLIDTVDVQYFTNIRRKKEKLSSLDTRVKCPTFVIYPLYLVVYDTIR